LNSVFASSSEASTSRDSISDSQTLSNGSFLVLQVLSFSISDGSLPEFRYFIAVFRCIPDFRAAI